MACVFLPVMTLTMTSLPANKYSTGMGIFNFTRMIASSFGIAVGVSLWNQRTVVHRSQIVERLDSTLVAANEATGLLANRSQSQESTWSVIERMATDQATTLAMNDVFLCLRDYDLLYSSTMPVRARPRESVAARND